MANILIVCTANICRSPVAEALLADRLAKRGAADWVVSSVGTWAMTQRGASRNSVELMARQGYDLSNHISRMVELDHLQAADLVLTMEIGHAEALRAEFPSEADKVYLLSEMTGDAYNISDPYGGPVEEYERMIGTLTQVIDSGIDRIMELAVENESARTTQAQVTEN